jgi:hypothetical protein
MPGVTIFLILWSWLIVGVFLPFSRPVAVMTVVTIAWATVAYRDAHQADRDRLHGE